MIINIQFCFLKWSEYCILYSVHFVCSPFGQQIAVKLAESTSELLSDRQRPYHVHLAATCLTTLLQGPLANPDPQGNGMNKFHIVKGEAGNVPASTCCVYTRDCIRVHLVAAAAEGINSTLLCMRESRFIRPVVTIVYWQELQPQNINIFMPYY